MMCFTRMPPEPCPEFVHPSIGSLGFLLLPTPSNQDSAARGQLQAGPGSGGEALGAPGWFCGKNQGKETRKTKIQMEETGRARSQLLRPGTGSGYLNSLTFGTSGLCATEVGEPRTRVGCRWAPGALACWAFAGWMWGITPTGTSRSGVCLDRTHLKRGGFLWKADTVKQAQHHPEQLLPKESPELYTELGHVPFKRARITLPERTLSLATL